MVHRMLFWAGFGVATRAWQLGIEMRPMLYKQGLWIYPVYAAVGASFGYWLQGVDDKQTAILDARKELILAKRARRAEREKEAAAAES